MSQILSYLQVNKLASPSFIDSCRKTWVFRAGARKQFITHSYNPDQSDTLSLFSEPPVSRSNTTRVRRYPCTHRHELQEDTDIRKPPVLDRYGQLTCTTSSPGISLSLRNSNLLQGEKQPLLSSLLAYTSIPKRWSGENWPVELLFY